MTSNDEQIDLLIRRMAPGALAPSDGAGHLDADEMSAFAEAALPAAARARYVLHLAECDQCRRQVSDLAIASGALARVPEGAIEKIKPWTFWATLGGLFSLPALRYAAFAAVLVIVAGVAFVALRRRPEAPPLIAASEPEQQKPVSALKPAGDTTNGAVNPNINTSRGAPALSQTPAPPAGLTSTTDLGAKVDQTKAPETMALESPKEVAKAGPEPMKKAEVPGTVQALPYSPPPPGESQSSGRFSQSQTQTGAAQAIGGGFKVQSADKSQAEDRERDATKDARLDDMNRQQANQPMLAQRRAADEKQKGGPSRNMDNNVAMNNRSANEMRTEAPRKAEGTASEEVPQVRSAGGRKFVRQGNRWVDQKYKLPMSLINVSRGSDEFAALDSGLRSIAQQLGGEVIVVWKSKAYLIK